MTMSCQRAISAYSGQTLAEAKIFSASDLANSVPALSLTAGTPLDVELNIRGITNTMPLHVEILYNEYNWVAAFAVASLLALLALITLIIKSLLEWRYGEELAAARGGH